MQTIGPLQPPTYAPLQSTGDGKQAAYLAFVPSPMAAALINLIGGEAATIVKRLRAQTPSDCEASEEATLDVLERQIEKQITNDGLLLYCRANRKRVSFVIVHSLSRFSRHVTDHHQIRALLSSFGIKLRSATEAIDETATGHFMESMFAAVAEYENKTKAERTVVGMMAAAEQGRWPFPPPLGYRVITTATQSQMEPDPERAQFVRMAFELFASGNYERTQVLRKITAGGLRTRKGKKVSPQTFSKILTNPIYAGRVSVPKWGVDRVGRFAPLISQETFHRVQAVLAGRRVITGPYSKEHPDFPLRHFVRCERCDKPLTASWSKGRSKKYAYYRCAHSECKYINSKKDSWTFGKTTMRRRAKLPVRSREGSS